MLDWNWNAFSRLSTRYIRNTYYLAPFVLLKFIFSDTPISMDDIDLELDEMELVAAAAGYYYYSCLTKQPSRCLSPRRCEFMTEVLNGNDDFCREMLRMDKHVFHKLCDILRQRAMLRDTAGVVIEEQLAIFLNIIGHNERNRVIQELFQHSGETISRHFNNVLKAIKSLAREVLQPAQLTTPPEILNSARFYPYFQVPIPIIFELLLHYSLISRSFLLCVSITTCATLLTFSPPSIISGLYRSN